MKNAISGVETYAYFLVILALTKADIPCAVGVTARSVSSTAEASALSNALLCSGPGQFEVEWSGDVLLSSTIVVSNGSSLKVTGSSLDADTAAVIDGGGAVRLFEAKDGSTLELTNISLVGGWSGGLITPGGGAVYATEQSSLTALDCSFASNYAELGGAIYSSYSTIIIEGDTAFANNTASRQGAASSTSPFFTSTFSTSTSSSSGEYVSYDARGLDGHPFTTDRGKGGAIYSKHGATTINGQTTFAKNIAEFLGGAIYSEHGNMTTEGQLSFTENASRDTGGAICSSSSNTTMEGEITFINNIADDGGAFYSSYSNTKIEGNTIFAGNTAAFGGGAIRSAYSTIVIKGHTTFNRNAATYLGGALSAFDSIIIFEGYTTFSDNSAGEDGGALRYHNSSITTEGQTTFAFNAAGIRGGAIYSENSTTVIKSQTLFENNNAGLAPGDSDRCDGIVSDIGNGRCDNDEGYNNVACLFDGGDCCSCECGQHGKSTEYDCGENGYSCFDPDSACFDPEASSSAYYAGGDSDSTWGDGGAIHSYGSDIVFNGETAFDNNTASANGGAVFLRDVDCIIDHTLGPLSFTGNGAGRNGGAIAAASGCDLKISGPISFVRNTAEGNGGAVFLSDGTIVTRQGTTFVGNKAVDGAGGGIYSSNAAVDFNGSMFRANGAVWGGGLALFSSGSDSRPANVITCVFERNIAIDGGGMYSAVGYDTIRNSLFEANVAEGSGGAYLHSGVLVELESSTFVGNRAGNDGLAILSLGVADDFHDVTFESNTFYCRRGEYGFDMDESEDEVHGTCRFETVCSRCASSCENTPSGWTSVSVVNSTTVPVCKPMLVGAGASEDAGTTLQTLELKRGYYRSSTESHNIVPCFQGNACNGGNNVSEYCASGYQGPYCATCQDDFASGYQYSCRSCVGDDQDSSIGTAAAVFVVVLVLLALVIANLTRVLDGNGGGGSAWAKKLSSWRERMASIVPLTSIKIILVAWQIVTQFTSVVNVVYPDIYEKFLSVLNLVNFDLGFIFSISCVLQTNFYGRLFFVTLAPLAALGTLGVTYAVARARNRHSPAGLLAAKSKFLSIGLFILFVVYSSVSYIVFQTFVCDDTLEEEDGVEYLRADYSLTCSTNAHTAMKVYAGLMIAVYPVGIPFALTWWFVSNRHDLALIGATSASSEEAISLEHLMPMQDLWAPYKPNRYFYEVVECGRRITLTGLAVFIYPGSSAQVALEVVFATIFIATSEMLSPFANPMDAWLYRAGSWVVFFSMYLALLLKVDASSEDEQSQEVFARLLIAANVGLVFMVMVQAALSVKRTFVSARDEPVARRSFRNLGVAQLCDEEADASGDSERGAHLSASGKGVDSELVVQA